jgi:hypothetical protein
VDESTKRETVRQARSIQPSENRPLYTFSISDRRTTRSTRLHPCHLVGPRIAVARLHRRLNRVPSWCPPSSCIPRLDVQGLLILASSAWDLHSFDRGGPMFDRSMSVQSVETLFSAAGVGAKSVCSEGDVFQQYFRLLRRQHYKLVSCSGLFQILYYHLFDVNVAMCQVCAATRSTFLLTALEQP